MTDRVNEAVAFAVELPDGSVSEFGWQDMRMFKHTQRIAVLGDGCRYVFAYRPTHPARGVVDAEDRFEQYVATLIAKNPDVRKLGERLADWLDEDRFNTINPILLGIAQRLAAQPAVPSVPEGWVKDETLDRTSRGGLI